MCAYLEAAGISRIYQVSVKCVFSEDIPLVWCGMVFLFAQTDMDTYLTPCQGPGCDAKRIVLLLCVVPIVGAHPTFSHPHLQLALQMEQGRTP